MIDITDRLERLYVEKGTNYVQEAAQEIRNLRAQVAKPDCRTCARYRLLGGPWCDIHDQCIDGNRYQPLPPVRLWKKT